MEISQKENNCSAEYLVNMLFNYGMLWDYGQSKFNEGKILAFVSS
jgi:hypothetical protein